MQFGQQELDKGRRRVSAVGQNHYTIFAIEKLLLCTLCVQFLVPKEKHLC